MVHLLGHLPLWLNKRLLLHLIILVPKLASSLSVLPTALRIVAIVSHLVVLKILILLLLAVVLLDIMSLVLSYLELFLLVIRRRVVLRFF